MMFKSKIHRATVTSADLNYEGSISIDEALLEASDILPYEQVHVWDVTNGARLVTYALKGARGSGVIQVNGGGAHLIKPGDIVIIATFTQLSSKKSRKFVPTVVFVDSENRIRTGLPTISPNFIPPSSTIATTDNVTNDSAAIVSKTATKRKRAKK